MNKKLPISCYIRTFNEESTIEKVVLSVIGFCSEVIVVDSQSTDRTALIAKSLGARVIEQEWLGNGCQKRVGEQIAEMDWLLDLDADEVVSTRLKNEIFKAFESGEERSIDVFLLKLVTVTPNDQVWKNSCLAWRQKLYRKSIYQIPDHKAWDQFKVLDLSKAKKLKGALYHYSFRNFEHLLNKMNRVSSVRAREKEMKSLPILCIRILFGFPFYWYKKFVYQKMFMTGMYGFISSILMAAQRWLTDIKMFENYASKNHKSS